MEHGKPKKSLAIAYSMKKRSERGKESDDLADCYGYGGEAKDDDDMISKIMQKHYSKGGRLANDTPITADFEDNQFDDLVERDDLEQHYTSENSGDEIGDRQEDEDREDIVSKIMRSRAKRDKMPRTA